MSSNITTLAYVSRTRLNGPFLELLKDEGFSLSELPKDYMEAAGILKGERFDRIVIEPLSLEVGENAIPRTESGKLDYYKIAQGLLTDIRGEGSSNKDTYAAVRILPLSKMYDIRQMYNGLADGVFSVDLTGLNQSIISALKKG